MKVQVSRNSIQIVPEGALDEAFIEDTLGLKGVGDSVVLKRVDVGGGGSTSLAYLETAENEMLDEPLQQVP